jgi:ABC-2 type transport system ATP-binding protein
MGLMSEQRDPDAVPPDRKSQEFFEPLAEVIAEALSARGSDEDRLETVEDAHRVAEPIAAAVLNRFVVRPRPAERVHDHVSQGAPAAGAGLILEVRDLSVVYGTKTAVDGVSLQITRGEIFGLLGPNGAGKTSTLSAIEGLIKPRSGAVFLDGVDVRRRPSQAKAKLGVQLQATSFQSQLTIKQIVRLYSGLYGLRLSDSEITAGLREIGLEGEASKPFKQMSGGQQQRLSLYVAVVHDPALLLLDEPTAGLDPQSRRQLWGRIEHIRQGGGSILLTTHSMEEAEAVCDRVAIIDHGTVLTCETPQNLIAKHQDDPEVRKVAHGEVTLEDVFIGLTGSEIRD